MSPPANDNRPRACRWTGHEAFDGALFVMSLALLVYVLVAGTP